MQFSKDSIQKSIGDLSAVKSAGDVYLKSMTAVCKGYL